MAGSSSTTRVDFIDSKGRMWTFVHAGHMSVRRWQNFWRCQNCQGQIDNGIVTDVTLRAEAHSCEHEIMRQVHDS